MYRVLVVDDEKLERDGIRFLLSMEEGEWEIYEAANGKLALNELRKHPVDLMLTDIKMPHMDGLELSKKAREEYPDLEIIIFSGYGDFAFAQEAIRYGVTDYVLKPVDPDRFHDTIQKIQKEIASRKNKEQQSIKEKSFLQQYFLLGYIYSGDQERLKEAEGIVDFSVWEQWHCAILIESDEAFFDSASDEVPLEIREELRRSFFYLNLNGRQSLLLFKDVLGTFFYFAFGNINEADFQTVPVAVVKEASADTFFMTYLDEVEKSSPDLLKAEEMSEKEALEALQDKKVEGIYYVGKEPSLTVAGTGIEESILQTVLDSCENTRTTITNIMKKNPQMDMETMKSLLSSDSLVREVSLGGRTIDGNVQFFYALIAMACLYGCFIGFGSAIGIQANITPLAARRCVTPTHKLKLILTDQLTSFALGYVDVIILILYLRYILNLDFQGQMGKMLVVSFFGSLIGVSMGMFIGSFGKMQEGVRIGLMLGISMVSSFLAGLMNGNMKDIVEKSVPFVNRINPASLISDAFYCINVYDDMTRYYRNLITLAVMCVVLVMASFFMVRRERYDSI